MRMDKLKCGQTDRQTDRHTDRQTDGQIVIYVDRQWQTNRQTDTYVHT